MYEGNAFNARIIDAEDDELRARNIKDSNAFNDRENNELRGQSINVEGNKLDNCSDSILILPFDGEQIVTFHPRYIGIFDCLISVRFVSSLD